MQDEKRATSASEIRDFAAKIRNSVGGDGLLVTHSGLSGKPGQAAHQAIGIELAHQVRITVITVDDIGKITTTGHLATLLQDRLAEQRVNQTYVSI